MGFRGITYGQPNNRAPKRQIIGFSGVRISIPGLTPVQVKDYRGKGLSNVLLTAENSTSGNSFSVRTDSNGSGLMQLDANTSITAKKELIEVVIAHSGESQHVITLDLPILE